MSSLFPFLALFCKHWFRISLGTTFAILTLLASIGLLMLSGWFLASCALAGLAGIFTFNYMLPSGGIRGTAIIRTASRYAERVISHDTTFRILAQLRVFTFSRLFPLSPGTILRYRQSDLLNRFVADIDTLDHIYLRLISPFISALMVIIIVTFGLSFINSSIALMLCSILLLLLFTLPLIFYRLGRPIGVQLTSIRSDYRTQLTIWLQGHAELTIFSAKERFRHKLNQIEQLWFKQQTKHSSISGLSQAFLSLASGSTFILILWVTPDAIGNDGAKPLIALFVFATLASFEALAPISGAFQHLSEVIASATQVKEILEQKPEVIFPTKSTLPTVSLKSSDLDSGIALSISDISFTYPMQSLPVIQNMCITAKNNEHIAILGKTGCGKSTLLQLLTRAWDPQSGNITLNNQSIQDIDEQTLRSMISVVNQRVHIFSATLRYNLLIACENAKDGELVQILQCVGLSYLLSHSGLDIWLGEGGRQLSGGEQRRIAVARALLHNGSLVLLDEPTEGLDSETERQIFALLLEHCQNKTMIMITHRLIGLNDMDNIFVMDSGRIVEQGNHNTLLLNKSFYYNFHQYS